MNRLLMTAVLVTALAPAVRGQDKAQPFEPKQLHKIQGHTGAVMGVAFSPDGKLLATASADKTVRLWDVAGGNRKQRIPNQEAAYCVAFSPDGKRLAVGSFGGAVNLFDVETGDKVKGFTTNNSVALIAWSSEGNVLATVAVNAETVVLMDTETGKASHTLKGHRNRVRGVAFSPDGKTLATVSDDSTARLWDVTTGKEADSLKAHDGPVHAVAFSADGKYLVTGGDDNTVVRWDIKSGNIVKPVMELPKEKNGGFRKVGVLPNGRVWGQTWGAGNAVFDAKTGDLVSRKPSLDGHIFYGGTTYGPNFLALNPDGKTYAVASGDDVYLWDASKAFGPNKTKD